MRSNGPAAAFVALFLFALAGWLLAQQQNPVPANPASIAKGKNIYAQYCSSCHGAKAEGGRLEVADVPKEVPNLVDEKWIHGGEDAQIFKTIKQGVPPDLIMEPFGKRLSDDDIWQVINYIRSLGKRAKG